MPEISIIMPVHDSEDTIDSSIHDLLCQSFSDFELIVIDDGSTDQTPQIIKQLMAKDNRIKYISQEQSGAAAARNKGIEIAQGTYCIFLDADDSFATELIQSLHSSIVQDNADICVCEADAFNLQTNKRYPLVRFRGTVPKSEDTEHLGAFLFKRCYTAPWNKLIKTELIKSHHLRYQNIAAHNDIYFVCACLAYSKKISFVNAPLVLYSIGSGQSIQDKRIRYPFCEFDALELLGREKCILDSREGECLYNAFRSLVVDAYFNSAPAIIAGGASFDEFHERFLKLMRHEDGATRLGRDASIIAKLKEFILLTSSKEDLQRAFSVFVDQRRHTLRDKLHFTMCIILSRLKK